MRNPWVLIGIWFLAMVLVACGAVVPAPPQTQPAVTGYIAEFQQAGTIMMVTAQRGDKDPAIAAVRITEKTVIVREQEKQRTQIPASTLTIGMAVRVWFDGPPRESMPIQADGLYIVASPPE